jgi:transposase
MYIETTPHKTKSQEPCWRVRVCENTRVNGKPRKRNIRSLGIAHSEAEVEGMRRLGAKIIEAELSKRVQGDLLFDSVLELEDSPAPEKAISSFTNLRETARSKEGVKQVIDTLFSTSGFDQLLPEPTASVLKDVVAARVEEPASKHKTQRYLEENKISEASLNQIYRMMDKLFGGIDTVNEIAIQDAKKLFQDKIDLVLFDVTTLYFESTEEDKLRSFGFSKDQKFHQTQIVLAMGVTKDGIPIGYKLFPGNTAETKTLIACLDEWKKQIEIGRVLFVADRGMFNSANLKALDEAGYEYVVAATLRRMKSEVTDKILDFKRSCEEGAVKDSCHILTLEHSIQVQKPQLKKGIEEELANGRLIVSYSQSRMAKDRGDRERILKKITKIVKGRKEGDTKSLISNKGFLKFAKISGKSIVDIDDDKVKKDAQWDGIHGLFSNAKMTPQEIQEYYRQLWTIEETFRIGKTDLEMRPIYHFKPERIQSHIAICFMALYLLRKLQLLLKRSTGESVSVAAIQESLEKVQTSRVVDMKTGFRFLLPSQMPPLAKEIYRVLGLKRSEIPRAY